MEVTKEGHLSLYMGVLSGWQRKYFIVDSVNGFFAFANTKNTLFASPSLSETIPASMVKAAIPGEGREFVVELKNDRKFKLRVERSDPPEHWVNSFLELAGVSPQHASVSTPSISIPNEGDSDGKAVRIHFKSGDVPYTKDYQALFIACDPMSFGAALTMTDDEQEIFQSQVRFTFQTTVVEAKAGKLSPEEKNGRLVPSIQRKMNGEFYAFRNETLKQFGPDVKTEKVYLTCYQILGYNLSMTSDELRAKLDNNLQMFTWFPYKEYQIQESFHCAYFSHFKNEDLVKGLPWKLLDIQGKNRTMFIHGSACFESVLHIWQYHELLFKKKSPALKMLPKNKSSAIAIVGAGPAGLMMAVRLARMGYENVELIEATERFGGKSVTQYKQTPQGEVVCELGTCYLSVDYDPFREYFKPFLSAEQPLPDLADRQVVTENELKFKNDLKTVDNFTNYAVAKAAEENDMVGFKNLTKADILFDFYRFAQLHDMIFHGEKPFPSRPPEALKGAFGKQTFFEFLKMHGLDSLIGVLQYAYQAQGYGSLECIPAFYGLVWVTPTLLMATFKDAVGFTIKPNTYESDTITYMIKGWQSVWDNVMKKYKFPIHYNSAISKIERQMTT